MMIECLNKKEAVLYTDFSNSVRMADEKLSIMEHEYDIYVEEKFRRDVNIMCNLSEGIEEKGIAIGRAEGEAELIIKMYKNGFTAEQIASATDKDIEEVKAIIAGKKPALA